MSNLLFTSCSLVRLWSLGCFVFLIDDLKSLMVSNVNNEVIGNTFDKSVHHQHVNKPPQSTIIRGFKHTSLKYYNTIKAAYPKHTEMIYQMEITRLMLSDCVSGY